MTNLAAPIAAVTTYQLYTMLTRGRQANHLYLKVVWSAPRFPDG